MRSVLDLTDAELGIAPIAPDAERACGNRYPGGLYIESSINVRRTAKASTGGDRAKTGIPSSARAAFGQVLVEPIQLPETEDRVFIGEDLGEMLFDPPVLAKDIILELPNGHVISAAELPSRGMVVARIRGDSKWHVWDVVGMKDYPYPVDFIEELRIGGLSRRMPPHLRIDLLSKDSGIFLLHDRGALLNAHEYYRHLSGYSCPMGHAHQPGEMCAGLWWCDLDLDDQGRNSMSKLDGRTMYGDATWKRRTGHRHYRCRTRPEGVKPEYARAVIAHAPIWRIVAIKSNDQEHQRKIQDIFTKSPFEFAILDR